MSAGSNTAPARKETKIKKIDNRKGETKMNTNRKELTLDEMEQVNAGSVLAAIGLGTACVCLAVEAAKFGRKLYNDIKGN